MFTTIEDAKSYLATGEPVNAAKASNLVVSDSILNRKAADIFADPFSLPACLSTYKTVTSGNKPAATAAQYEGVEAMFRIICENHLIESFAEDLLHSEGEVADTYRGAVSFPVNFQELCKNAKSKRFQNLTELKTQVYRIFCNSLKVRMCELTRTRVLGNTTYNGDSLCPSVSLSRR